MMKEKFKKLIAFLLMMIVVISSLLGCNKSEKTNGGQKNKAMGRYVATKSMRKQPRVC